MCFCRLIPDLLFFCIKKWNKSRFCSSLHLFFAVRVGKNVKYLCMQHTEAVLLSVTSILYPAKALGIMNLMLVLKQAAWKLEKYNLSLLLLIVCM